MNVFTVKKTSKEFSTEEKHCAVIYLHHVKEYATDKIAEITEYAKSTIRTIIRTEKEYLINKAKSLFDEIVETILSGRTVDNGKDYYSCRRSGSSKFRIDWNGLEEKAHKGYCAYVVELLDEAKRVIFTKVGYSANCIRRFAEETGSYVGIAYVKVRQLYYFNSEPQAKEHGEDILRDMYRKKYPNDYLRNDRFTVYYDPAISL